jgi:Domain of Unknown Function (DUF1080)/WD40-like Beta Propeller Repeat
VGGKPSLCALLAALSLVTTSASLSAPVPEVAFVASATGRVVLLAADGRAVGTLGRGESPAFSADGSRIAFVRDGDVFTIGSDGRGLVRVTRTPAREESPDWSPGGALVYASNRAGRLGLYVQAPGRPARRLTHPPQQWQEDRAPAWSPDGNWIAFASTRPSAFNQELYLVRRNGTGLRRLTFTRGSDGVLGDDGMPAWRPDGRGLVFVSNRDRNLELYGLDLRTRRTTRLTRTASVDESLPRVAPDGRVAFVAGSRIAVASASLRGRRVLGRGTAIDWRPAAPPPAPETFIDLFDGRSTDGWTMTGPGGFVVENGALVSEGGMGLLWYDRRTFRDFELEVEWRVDQRCANSGIFLRFPSRPRTPQDAVAAGYEVQIDDCDPRGLEFQTGSIYDFAPAARLASRPAGQWNRYEIRVVGQHYTIVLNGERVTEFDGARGAFGYVGLQNHDPGSRVSFRTVRVRRLE